MNSNKNRKNEYKSPSIPPINNKLEKKKKMKDDLKVLFTDKSSGPDIFLFVNVFSMSKPLIYS